MTIIDTETIVPTDIDDTLVIWNNDYHKPKRGRIKFKDGKDVYYLKPHKKHIDLIKRYYRRGYTIIAWSGNGYAWASHVVRVLKLEKYISFVATKPQKYIDDCPVENWCQRIYIKP